MFIPLDDWAQVMTRLTVETITQQTTLAPIMAVPVELEVDVLFAMRQENIRLLLFEQKKQWSAEADKKRLILSLK